MAAVLWLLLTLAASLGVCCTSVAVTTIVWPPESVETEATPESVFEAVVPLVPAPVAVVADTSETEPAKPVV